MNIPIKIHSTPSEKSSTHKYSAEYNVWYCTKETSAKYFQVPGSKSLPHLTGPCKNLQAVRVPLQFYIPCFAIYKAVTANSLISVTTNPKMNVEYRADSPNPRSCFGSEIKRSADSRVNRLHTRHTRKRRAFSFSTLELSFLPQSRTVGGIHAVLSPYRRVTKPYAGYGQPLEKSVEQNVH